MKNACGYDPGGIEGVLYGVLNTSIHHAKELFREDDGTTSIAY